MPRGTRPGEHTRRERKVRRQFDLPFSGLKNVLATHELNFENILCIFGEMSARREEVIIFAHPFDRDSMERHPTLLLLLQLQDLIRVSLG